VAAICRVFLSQGANARGGSRARGATVRARRSTQPVWPGSDGPPEAALSEADFAARISTLKEDYIAELERVLKSLREALATIESTRTWRLRRRSLPFIRLVRRIGRM